LRHEDRHHRRTARALGRVSGARARREGVEITDEKGRIAQLVPAAKVKSAADFNAKIEAAIAAGTLRRGTGKLPDDFLTRPLVKSTGSVLEALLEEREEGW
jgi:hypothetical protein